MSTLEQLTKSIARVARISEADIKPEMKLKDIKADSLHWVQIIVGLENSLGVEIDIDREKMARLATIQDFVNYVEAAAKKG
jgi:acyl carrier protein